MHVLSFQSLSAKPPHLRHKWRLDPYDALFRGLQESMEICVLDNAASALNNEVSFSSLTLAVATAL
jgi:hypothetical protein